MPKKRVQVFLVLITLAILLSGTAIWAWWRWQRPDESLVASIATKQVPSAIAVSSHAHTIVAAFPGCSVSIWQRIDTTLRQTQTFHCGSGIPAAVAIDHRETLLVVGDNLGNVWLWDMQRGTLLRQLPALVPVASPPHDPIWPDSHGIVAIAIDRDATTIAVGGVNGQMSIVDVSARAVEQQLHGHPVIGGAATIQHLLFHPDGERLVSAADDREIWIWRTGTWQVEHKLRSSFGNIQAVGVHHQDHLTAVDGHRQLKTWSLQQYRLIQDSLLPFGWIPSAAISVTGELAVGGSAPAGTPTSGLPIIGQPDPAIYRGRLPAVDLDRKVTGHRDRVDLLEFSPEGTYLLSASSDHTLKLWKAGRQDKTTGHVYLHCSGLLHQAAGVASPPIHITPSAARGLRCRTVVQRCIY